MVLEQLVRGNSLRESNEGTQLFANSFQRMLKKSGCLTEDSVLIIEKLRAAFRADLIDMQILCDALGTKALQKDLIEISSNDGEETESAR